MQNRHISADPALFNPPTHPHSVHYSNGDATHELVY